MMGPLFRFPCYRADFGTHPKSQIFELIVIKATETQEVIESEQPARRQPSNSNIAMEVSDDRGPKIDPNILWSFLYGLPRRGP